MSCNFVVLLWYIVVVTPLSSVYRIMLVICDAFAGPDLAIKYILSLILSFNEIMWISSQMKLFIITSSLNWWFKPCVGDTSCPIENYPQGRRRRGAGGSASPLSKVGAQVGLCPPPTFGQSKCSNCTICSYFVVKNTIFSKFSWLASLANFSKLIFSKFCYWKLRTLE